MGITQGIANELNLSKEDLKLLNKNGGATIWTQVLKKAQAGQFIGTDPGTLDGADKIVGRNTNNLKKSEWSFKDGDTVKINQTKFDEIRQLIHDRLALLKGKSPVTLPDKPITPEKPEATLEEMGQNIKIKGLSIESAPQNEAQLNTARSVRGYSPTETILTPKAAPANPTPAPPANPTAVETPKTETPPPAPDASKVEYSDLSGMRNGQNVTINGETYSARYGAHGLVFDGPDGTYNLDEMQQFFEE